jgi:DNA-binding HxlR family transcriptional regulator
VTRPKPRSYNCSVEATLDVIGGKWKVVILWWLHQQTWRFAELRRKIPRITEKMLTQQLRELERDGIVSRLVHATVPPKVEYSLTEYGRSLERALGALCDWGRGHAARIGAALVIAGKGGTTADPSSGDKKKSRKQQ